MATTVPEPMSVAELTFAGVPYVISVGGTFPASYVEEITHKTGNYKPFHVFLRMLVSALDGSSDSVYIDLLTYADLEALKQKRNHADRHGASALNGSVAGGPNARASKRYLILTYAVEFDRVHFPLPLTYLEYVDAPTLQRTIKRLRSEIAELRAAGPGAASVSFAHSDETALVARLQAELAQAREEARMARDLAAEAAEQSRRIAEESARRNDELRGIIADLEAQLAARPRAPRPAPRPARDSPRRSGAGRPRRASSTSRSRRDPSPGAASGADSASASRSRSRVKARVRRKTSRSRGGSPAGAAFPRFDPTAYVREQKRKMASSSKTSSKWGPPPRRRASSRSSSRASSRASSRRGSLDSDASIGDSRRRTSRRRSRSASRAAHVADRLYSASTSASKAKAKSRRANKASPTSRSKRSSSRNKRSRATPSGLPKQRSLTSQLEATLPPRNPPGADGLFVAPPRAGPGAAHSFFTDEPLSPPRHARRSPPRSSPPRSSPPRGDEIYDINARLDALQSFLKGAKRSDAYPRA
ncbi:coiled-coil domain-containing protein 61 [Thecamonas trahens ATCC 50062]|uniref:Coiled-coil domain-containing protein 61 n=1 Tax=Thecamonas trahens ATCC 50062 TaxID=461836 RepID=A0A0L0DBB1_THETB|nr:coiled-coil domain-containing protein 61 [Thecamonas trahens ATCC 50062]KNC49629.1 coiled-coil domain-containing protein 61 [Thecamonas trahens ATCC 50062]|eukprot:XP_013757734.1 coiled-coil domain-containing protein 61 [Thecamonas trahens ATCC 50062]